MKTKCLILFAMACAIPAHGATRISANYSLAAEVADSGGQRTASANYTNDGSAGAIAGVASAAAPEATARAGYVSQLFEITGLALNAAPANVNETATCQLGVWQVLDDASFIAVSPASVAWSVVTGPLTGIAAAGLATAGTVYQDSSATVQGVCGGFTGTLNLTVLNVLPDNFGSYAGDGLDDAWQTQYFGTNHSAAGPLRDPDGDGQSNQLEFTAGTGPTDPNSRFHCRLEPVPGQPGRMRLVFSPRWVERSYAIVTSTTLQANGWATLTNATTSDNGTERTVTDTSAIGSRKFYRVQVVKP